MLVTNRGIFVVGMVMVVELSITIAVGAGRCFYLATGATGAMAYCTHNIIFFDDLWQDRVSLHTCLINNEIKNTC